MQASKTIKGALITCYYMILLFAAKVDERVKGFGAQFNIYLHERKRVSDCCLFTTCALGGALPFIDHFSRLFFCLLVTLSNMATSMVRTCYYVVRHQTCILSRRTRFNRKLQYEFHSSSAVLNGVLLSLNKRGVLKECFPESAAQDRLPGLLQAGSQAVYCGFDPTADSLHLGNLLALIALLHFRNAGHHILAVVGGATAQIGDPSGKTSERERLTADAAEANSRGIRESLHRIFTNHELYFHDSARKLGTVTVLNNLSWYRDRGLVEFLAEAGRHFRMGTMLSRHSVQARLRSPGGMSLTEFTYQVFQAYDFYHLNQIYGCKIQLGGSDQLGNLMSGHEYIHK